MIMGDVMWNIAQNKIAAKEKAELAKMMLQLKTTAIDRFLVSLFSSYKRPYEDVILHTLLSDYACVIDYCLRHYNYFLGTCSVFSKSLCTILFTDKLIFYEKEGNNPFRRKGTNLKMKGRGGGGSGEEAAVHP